MSFTRENLSTIVQNNPDEVCAILNMMHVLGPAYQNLTTLCKANDIKLKGKKCGTKRPPSQYNLFTSLNKDHAELKELSFGERAKKLSVMWKNVQTNSKEKAKYDKLHADAVLAFQKASPSPAPSPAQAPVASKALAVAPSEPAPVEGKAKKVKVVKVKKDKVEKVVA